MQLKYSELGVAPVPNIQAPPLSPQQLFMQYVYIVTGIISTLVCLKLHKRTAQARLYTCYLSTWGFWHRRRVESGAWSQSRSCTEHKLTFSGGCRTTEKQRLHVSKHHIATADSKGSNECRKAALRFVHTANMQRCATQQGQRSPKQQPPPWGEFASRVDWNPWGIQVWHATHIHLGCTVVYNDIETV